MNVAVAPSDARRPLPLCLALLLVTGLAMSGCMRRTYLVGETEFDYGDEEWKALAPQIEAQEPDDVVNKSSTERLLVFYSGKVLLTGPAGDPSRKDKERIIIDERNGQMFIWHRTMQYIQVHHFSCGNISGHGSFCATEVYRECEVWSERTLRSRCPDEVRIPLY